MFHKFGVTVITQLLLCSLLVNIIFSCVTPGAPNKYNPLTPYFMSKVIRSYQLIRDVLHCHVDFLPDDADFQDDLHWSASGPEFRQIHLSAIVGPSARRNDDFKVSSMNCSRSLIFDEISLFCSTIKQMYQL